MITKTPIFVYGTLCHPQVVRVLLGASSNFRFTGEAQLKGYSRHPVRDNVFPAMIPSEWVSTVPGAASTSSSSTDFVSGWLLEGLNPTEEAILDWFEEEYTGEIVDVQPTSSTNSSPTRITPSQTVIKAKAYIWKREELDHLKLDQEWSYQVFCDESLDSYLEETVRPCRLELELLGMANGDT